MATTLQNKFQQELYKILEEGSIDTTFILFTWTAPYWFITHPPIVQLKEQLPDYLQEKYTILVERLQKGDI